MAKRTKPVTLIGLYVITTDDPCYFGGAHRKHISVEDPTYPRTALETYWQYLMDINLQHRSSMNNKLKPQEMPAYEYGRRTRYLVRTNDTVNEMPKGSMRDAAACCGWVCVLCALPALVQRVSIDATGDRCAAHTWCVLCSARCACDAITHAGSTALLVVSLFTSTEVKYYFHERFLSLSWKKCLTPVKVKKHFQGK